MFKRDLKSILIKLELNLNIEFNLSSYMLFNKKYSNKKGVIKRWKSIIF